MPVLPHSIRAHRMQPIQSENRRNNETNKQNQANYCAQITPHTHAHARAGGHTISVGFLEWAMENLLTRISIFF